MAFGETAGTGTDLAFYGTRILKLVLRALRNLSILGLETSGKEMDLVWILGSLLFRDILSRACSRHRQHFQYMVNDNNSVKCKYMLIKNKHRLKHGALSLQQVPVVCISEDIHMMPNPTSNSFVKANIKYPSLIKHDPACKSQSRSTDQFDCFSRKLGSARTLDSNLRHQSSNAFSGTTSTPPGPAVPLKLDRKLKAFWIMR